VVGTKGTGAYSVASCQWLTEIAEGFKLRRHGPLYDRPPLQFPLTISFANLSMKAGSSNAMYLLFFLSFYPFRIRACEGECISGVTNVFNGNYTIPVQLTVLSLVSPLNTPYMVPTT
jgi:hypothetical protein